MADLFIKLAGAELDYTLNWAAWLDAKTIAQSSWQILDAGITKESDAFTDTTSTIIVSGGTGGSTYAGLNTIVDSGGYTEQRLVGWLVPTEANLKLLALLRNYQGIERDSSNALLSRAISVAIKWIEGKIHRQLEAQTESRYFEQEATVPGDPLTLELDRDLLSITTLTDAAGTVIPASEYWLLPRGADHFDRIRLKAGSAYSWQWPLDGWAEVAGSWGYCSTIPGDLEQAILRLAAFLFRQKDAQIFDVVAEPSVGTITVPQGFERSVADILRAHKRGGLA